MNKQKIFQRAAFKKINLTVDTTFFKGRCGFGVTVFRSESENIYWNYCESEKLIEYQKGLDIIDQQYQVISVTIDGRRGLRQLIQRIYSFSVPVQYCHFHQVQTIIKYTTKKPKTDCGKDLRKLILKLKNLTEEDFTNEFNKLIQTYKDFLKEKNEQGSYSHQNLRKAFRSIKNNLPYLFTFQEYPELKIPTTTNSADGSFGQWKKKIKLHNGISRNRKMQMINRILANKSS